MSHIPRNVFLETSFLLILLKPTVLCDLWCSCHTPPFQCFLPSLFLLLLSYNYFFLFFVFCSSLCGRAQLFFLARVLEILQWISGQRQVLHDSCRASAAGQRLLPHTLPLPPKPINKQTQTQTNPIDQSKNRIELIGVIKVAFKYKEIKKCNFGCKADVTTTAPRNPYYHFK